MRPEYCTAQAAKSCAFGSSRASVAPASRRLSGGRPRPPHSPRQTSPSSSAQPMTVVEDAPALLDSSFSSRTPCAFCCLFAIVVLMTAFIQAETLPAPPAITDPKQITSKPDARVEKNLTIEKLYMTRQVGGATWSPDGKTVAFVSNLSGRNNLWTVASEGGWPMQLTVSDQRQTSPTWSPDGKWIAYMSDYDGDEQWDIFLVSPKNGQVVNRHQHTRDRRRKSGMVARRPLPRLHGQAKDVIRI